MKGGVAIPRFQSHKAVITELRRSGHPQADMLDELKSMRQDSDYDLVNSVTALEVARALILAEHIWPTM